MSVSTHSSSKSVLTYHLVDGLYNRQHLLIADLAVAVNVVQLEGPVELVFHLSPTCNAERADELFEVDRAGFVRVEDVENIICKR